MFKNQHTKRPQIGDAEVKFILGQNISKSKECYLGDRTKT